MGQARREKKNDEVSRPMVVVDKIPRAFSSVGQSVRLIPGLSSVRAREGPS